MINGACLQNFFIFLVVIISHLYCIGKLLHFCLWRVGLFGTPFMATHSDTVHSFIFTVSAPRFIADFPTRVIKCSGETLDLRCTISGTPNPILSWKFNGQVIVGNNPRVSHLNGNRRLVVRNLATDDAGVYTCVARNQHGEVSRSSTVVVQGGDPFSFLLYYTVTYKEPFYKEPT